MRRGFDRVSSVFHFVGGFLEILGVVFLVPLVVVAVYWGKREDGVYTALAFVIPALIAFAAGMILRNSCRAGRTGASGSMLICVMSWLVAAALGALPYVFALGVSYLNGFFEAMSGFTTTGITVFVGLDTMPRSILFWRALSEWVGGLGILSFFLVVAFGRGGGHQVFLAESHKISSGRPVPGLFHTIRILWGIYLLFTIVTAILLVMQKMSCFDSVCHAFTALSTGGFSPHDASIAFYRDHNSNYRLIEYTLTLAMILGGMNFLVHYRLLQGDLKALWDHTEVRYWWRFLAFFVVAIMLEHLHKHGILARLMASVDTVTPGQMEEVFRNTIFQVVSILTTTGFATQDIGSDFFPAFSKQLFLVMMVVGGCVGSTSGGFKVLRVAVLDRLMLRELFRLRVSRRASSQLVIDKKMIPDDEVRRTAALFFTWIALLVLGGGITAVFTGLGAWESFSGMFSALGNIGPCYISAKDMTTIHPAVKVTYILGMLAGRLEILPVLLLFSRKAWR